MEFRYRYIVRYRNLKKKIFSETDLVSIFRACCPHSYIPTGQVGFTKLSNIPSLDTGVNSGGILNNVNIPS
jgi:hypothetical protein